MASAIEERENSSKENSSKLTEAGERISALLRSENSLKQQLASKDRVLLQMNAELFSFRNKENPSGKNNDVLKSMLADEGEIAELRAQVAQLTEDNKRIDSLELRLASANRAKTNAEDNFKKLNETMSKLSIPVQTSNGDISRQNYGIFGRLRRQCGFPHANAAREEELAIKIKNELPSKPPSTAPLVSRNNSRASSNSTIEQERPAY